MSQEKPGVTRKFGLGVQNEAGQRLIEFCQENALVITNTLFQQHNRRLYIWTSPLKKKNALKSKYIQKFKFLHLPDLKWPSSISKQRENTGITYIHFQDLVVL